MKKIFLILGIIGSFCVMRGYAEDIVSAETPGVTVARAGRVGPRVNKQNATNVAPAVQISENLDMAIGEVIGNANGGYMACPPECSFLRNSEGGFATPMTCVNHGIECVGLRGGIKFYEEYPTDYAVGAAESNETEDTVDSMVKIMQKSDMVSVDRAAAKVGVKANTTKPVNVTTSTHQGQIKVADGGNGGAVAINCPAGCTPDCVILNNIAICECKNSSGKSCKADIVVSEKSRMIQGIDNR